MSEAAATVVSIIFVVVMIVAVVVCVGSCSYKDGYKDGYVKACGDAHQGKLRYELKESPDGTRIWEKKED